MKTARFKQYLLSGVSYAIPFVASGGILIAVSIAFAAAGAEEALITPALVNLHSSSRTKAEGLRAAADEAAVVRLIGSAVAG